MELGSNILRLGLLKKEDRSNHSPADASRCPWHPDDKEDRIANVMVHKILLPSSDEKSLHEKHRSSWVLGSTMTPAALGRTPEKTSSSGSPRDHWAPVENPKLEI